MLFAVQDRLIEMRNRPSLRNMIPEKFRQLVGSLLRDRIPPCAERHHQLVLPVKRHIPVHHGAEPDGPEFCQLLAVLRLHILCQLPIAVLQSRPDILQTVSPDAVLQPVLPVMRPRRDRLIVLIHQHGLDPG